MRARKSLILLIGIMTGIVLFVTGTTLVLLYRVGLEDNRSRLLATVKSTARVLEAVETTRDHFAPIFVYPEHLKATLLMARVAQQNFNTFDSSREMHLGWRDEVQREILVFTVHRPIDDPLRIPFSEGVGKPMRQALAGQAGSLISRDIYGVSVLAAYEPLKDLKLGLVAKVNLADLREPYIRAGIVAALVALAAVLIGAFLFVRVTSPLLNRLVESEARYRDVVDSTSDWMWEMDADLRFSHFSESHAKYFGTTLQPPIGRTRFDGQLPDDDPEKWERHREDLMARRPFRDFEYTLKLEDGRQIVTSTSGTPIFDGKGVFRGYRGAGRDVTKLAEAEKELRRSDERWRSFTDSATENMSLFDSELRIVEINRNVLHRFGMEKEQMVGRKLHEITTDPDSLNRAERYAEVLRTGKPVAFSGRARHSRLGERVYEFRAFPVGDGVGVISTDITERKKIEAMKNEFVSVVSHELRTPLTAIMGTLHILKSGMTGALSKKAAEIVGIAEKNSERLLSLINDILDVDKIESGSISFNMSPVRLHALVAHSVKVNRALGESGGITLNMAGDESDAVVLGDYDRLMQVMANLLSNAVKFSPRKGEVEVAVSQQNGSVRVTVRDHGGGVPEEFREHAFEKFSQADSSPSRPKGGTGLGLNICRSIVEKHSGSIDFHAAADGGTVFFFDLPEYKGDAQPAPETSA